MKVIKALAEAICYSIGVILCLVAMLGVIVLFIPICIIGIIGILGISCIILGDVDEFEYDNDCHGM